jgi:hypothetical protein
VVSDDVRREIQIRVIKYLDYRYWNSWNIIEVNKIKSIIENANGVIYLPEQYFYPTNDIMLPKNYFPVLRSFVMQDLDGTILSSVTGSISPIYYPNDINIAFMADVLKNI